MINLSYRKKLLFYITSVLLPCFFIALLEFSLRLFSFGDDLRLFVPSSDPHYLEANRLVGKRFFSKFEQTQPSRDPFLKEKPASGYRIVVLGESTVQGFPYEANLAFPRILQRRLQDIFLERNVEVVNLGMTAVTSYTLLDFADEVIEQKPDAVLIYTGHNEYYGALGVGSMENGAIPHWLKRLHLKLVHFKTYQLLQKSVASISRFISPVAENDPKATLMERIVAKNLIPYNSKMYADGLTQFSDNMTALLEKLKEARVPVIISDLVSNVGDMPPFRSMASATYPRADSVYSDARRLEAGLSFEKSKEEYLRAKDLDVIRFRASEDLNRLIADIADSLHIYRVSIKALFESNSPHGIVGDNLMIDHLHPNIDGYFLMAEGFFVALREHGMIEKRWDSTRVRSWRYYRQNWGFTDLDSMIAVVRIKHLKSGWPFQPETTVNSFRSTYIPQGIIDSLAFVSVEYLDVTPVIVHKKLAAYYQSIGDLRRASKEYFSLAYRSPSDASSFYYAADFAYKAGDYTNAARYLRESPHADTSSFAQFTLASIYSSQNNDVAALACIAKLEQLPLDKRIYLQAQKLKYRVQQDSGLRDDAERTLAAIKNVDPSFDESDARKSHLILIPDKIKSYLERAEALKNEGQFSEAIAVLKEANKIREIPYTNLLIGKMLFAQKSLDALNYLEKAHEEIKDDPSLMFSLCLLYLMDGNIPKAKARLDDFERLEGKNHPRSKQLETLFERRVGQRKTNPN